MLSYGQLADRVARLASGFGKLGLKPGDRVGLAMKNCVEYHEVLFACWHAGLVAVPMNAKLHAKEFASLLERAEIPTRVLDSEAQVMWDKLVRLNALALTTSATDRQVGFIRSDPEWRAILDACVHEGARVARAEGAEVDREEVMEQLDDAHETLGSSMQRDIAAGREPELDAIPGAVLRAGARHGIGCPTIERAVGLIAARAAV